MIFILLLIPLLALLIGSFVYRYNGRKDLLKLDSVQFFYAFILSPVLFVWLKSLLYLILRSELEISLSSSDIFLIDTAFSIIFLYVFAFIVMHSLTKTFSLKMKKDPLYDIFHHSEYFHLWLTHLVIHLGGLIILNAIATINVFVPISVPMSNNLFHALVFSGIIAGIFLFLGLWISDPKQQKANYMRVIKMAAGILFLGNVIGYFVFNVPFSPSYSFYWWNSFVLVAFVSLSLFAYKSERAQNLFERVASWFKHHDWDFRIQLFDERK